jgi:hypothetical protein
MKNNVTIFRSLDPKPYAKAVATLQSARIPFQAWDNQEGSVRFPRTMHMIAVSSESEDAARRAIAHIPSEIIFSSNGSAHSEIDRRTVWIFILALFFFVLVAIYQTFF